MIQAFISSKRPTLSEVLCSIRPDVPGIKKRDVLRACQHAGVPVRENRIASYDAGLVMVALWRMLGHNDV